MVAVGMVRPTLIAHGTDARRSGSSTLLLRRGRSGATLQRAPAPAPTWPTCTKAVLDGDEFVVNGQKVGPGVFSTATGDPACPHRTLTSPSRKGITYLLVDMRSRHRRAPRSQINGVVSLQRGLLLHDVQVPKENMIGELPQGGADRPRWPTSARPSAAAGHQFDHLAAWPAPLAARTTRRPARNFARRTPLRAHPLRRIPGQTRSARAARLAQARRQAGLLPAPPRRDRRPGAR